MENQYLVVFDSLLPSETLRTSEDPKRSLKTVTLEFLETEVTYRTVSCG
jgi:hypothetical protein